MSETKTFLEYIFSYIEDKQYFLVWTLPDKVSMFFDDVDEAVKYIGTVKAKADVYYGVGLHGMRRSQGRGSAATIVGIPSIWADIDISDPVHAKENLPPSIEAVLDILKKLPWQPSIIIHSGHGLQANWKLREVYKIDDDADRVVITRWVQRFQGYLRDVFHAHGWTMDATHDIARVMRIPGTFNRKRDPVVQTSILQFSPEIEYNLSDFSDLPEIETGSTAKILSREIGEITLDPNSTAPTGKFKALCDADLQFSRTWDRDRPDFPSGDQSQSTYDMSLATQAAMAGWSPQEIVNLVIDHRRTYKQDLKLRLDYYKSLVEKAYIWANKIREEKEIERELSDDAPREPSAIVPEDRGGPTIEEKEAAMGFFSKLWGVRVMRIVRTLGDPVRWRVEVSVDGQTVRVELGDAGFTSQKEFQKCMQNKAKIYIPAEKPSKWDKIAAKAVRCADDQDLGTEMTDEGQIRDWLMDYLDTRPPYREDHENYRQSILNKQPFLKTKDNQTKIHFFIDVFMEWVNTMKRGHIRRRNDLVHLLSLINCNPETVHIKINNRDTTRRTYALPVTFLYPEWGGDHHGGAARAAEPGGSFSLEFPDDPFSIDHAV